MELRKREIPGSNDQLMIGYAGENDIRALLELLGMLAKATGSVTTSQINEVERFMLYQLPRSEREFAIAAFRKGKEIPPSKNTVSTRAFELYKNADERWLEPVQVLDVMLRVALIDGKLSALDEHIVDWARATMGVHIRSYWILRDTLAERLGVKLNRPGMSFARPESAESSNADDTDGGRKRTKSRTKIMSRVQALAVLELDEDADAKKVKLAHRALVKRFHPDMVEGAKTSDEELKKAMEKFCEIQEAYEVLMGA